MRRILLNITICLASFIALPVFAQAGAGAEFHRLIEEHWAWYLEQSPETKSRLGDQSAANRWDDESLAAHYERDTRRGEFLTELATIDVTALDSTDQLNHAMLVRQLNSKRKRHELGLYLMTISMRGGPQQLYTIAEYTPFEDEQDYRNWIMY